MTQPIRAHRHIDGNISHVGTFVKLDDHNGCVVYAADPITFEKAVGSDGVTIEDLYYDGYMTVTDALRDGWVLDPQ